MSEEDKEAAPESVEESPEPKDQQEEDVVVSRAEFDALKNSAASRQDMNDVRAAIGRMQSLVMQAEKSSDTSNLTKQVADQFGGVSDLMKAIAVNEDMPLDIRQKAQDATAAATRAADRTALRDEIVEELGKQEDSTPKQESNTQLEAQLVSEIQQYGLDPDSALFDWQEATGLLKSSGEAAVTNYIRRQIRSGISDDDADGRRAERKEKAGAGAPPPESPGISNEEILDAAGDPTKSLTGDQFQKTEAIIRGMVER